MVPLALESIQFSSSNVYQSLLCAQLCDKHWSGAADMTDSALDFSQFPDFWRRQTLTMET